MMDNDQKESRAGFNDPSSIDDMAEMYLTAIKGVLASLPEIDSKAGNAGSDVMYLLAQAQAKWLSSALRYWQQVATIINVQGGDAMNVIKPGAKESSDEARRLMLLDKARAALREISDLSMSEAKLLQQNLMDVERELRDIVSGTTSDTDSDEARRYARAKR